MIVMSKWYQLETRRASTQNAKDGTQNVGRASTKDQQPYSIAILRDKCTIKEPMVLRIWFLMN